MSAQPSGKTQRRANILRAARDLMRETGDLTFSMRSLAEQAGVSIATPYNLFGSKQTILLAVLDADLAAFQERLAGLQVDEIEVLFEANRLLSSLLGGEPTFYRNVLRAVVRDGPEFRFMVNGPRYLAWKRLLRQATEAGLLVDHVDPDAFAIASSQLSVANVMEWVQGGLTLEEMDARNEYGLALTLLAIATDRSRPYLERHLREAEQKLQQHWRGMLMSRLRHRELDDTTRELLADQLKHLNLEHDKETNG
jgi:AcrR family transcriptional regulator